MASKAAPAVVDDQCHCETRQRHADLGLLSHEQLAQEIPRENADQHASFPERARASSTRCSFALHRTNGRKLLCKSQAFRGEPSKSIDCNRQHVVFIMLLLHHLLASDIHDSDEMQFLPIPMVDDNCRHGAANGNAHIVQE